MSGTQIGHFRAAGVPVKRHVVEFRVSQVNVAAGLQSASILVSILLTI